MGKSRDAFRTISEVADWLETQAHVLRFWESKFTQVKPVKRAGGRRYYRPADMRLLGGIKKLLHDDGMTIKGAQKLLREKGVKHVAALSQPLDDEVEATDKVMTSSVEEVQPPEIAPAAKVLDFASSPPPAVDDDAVGDLFPMHSMREAEDNSVQDQPAAIDKPEDDEATVDVEAEEDTGTEDLPDQDELPAFLQRVTFETVSDSDDIPSEDPGEQEIVELDDPPAPVAPQTEDPAEVQESEAAEAVEAQDDTLEAPQKEPPAMPEPGKSILHELAQTQDIATENRDEARVLLEQLGALRARVAES